jgi:hypothetical protein
MLLDIGAEIQGGAFNSEFEKLGPYLAGLIEGDGQRKIHFFFEALPSARVRPSPASHDEQQPQERLGCRCGASALAV